MKTLLVLRKQEFDQASKNLLQDLTDNLGIKGITNLKIGSYYFIKGVPEDSFNNVASAVLSDKQTDEVYLNNLPSSLGEHRFGVRFLPAQYDQRSDSAVECMRLLMNDSSIAVVSSKVIFFDGKISDDEINAIKSYYINLVDSCEIDLESTPIFEMPPLAGDAMPEIQKGFIDLSDNGLKIYLEENEMAMTLADLKHCQNYFKNEEKRDPSYTEIKVIDTYWSDHCRHTTFATEIKDVIIEDGELSDTIKTSFENYKKSREYIYSSAAENRKMCLMDLATVGMKELKKKGYLDNLDVSEEINACGIHINVDIDGKEEPYILLFKNETHNHPTEIEPFGGAGTCLGGAIRDPLSGRGYVFGAIRVTGCADPHTKIEDTLPGRLPQRVITKTAANGYSAYGNQIGLAGGKVKEFYHPGFVAKRMECGAVVGCVPLENVRREEPTKGDFIVLVGGKTGKDGIGGATGSSVQHTEESLQTGGSQVQKGNPTEERKIVRFMRRKEVSRLIKRCNDFGAGGVAVAIGELCDGLDINLNAVPLKYDGLTATDITISESQERMAMVIEAKDFNAFVKFADEENLDATKVAEVTDTNRLKIFYDDKAVVDISRDFLDTNGVTPTTSVRVEAPKGENYFASRTKSGHLEEIFLETMTDLNNASNKGLAEQFDTTVGGITVLHPLGGKYQLTENDSLVMKIPVLEGKTDTCAYMSYGYNPYLTEYSPYLGGHYAVVESITRLVACGADYNEVRLSFQEYFPRLGNDPARWGLPFSALLGALDAQKGLNAGSVGGKDSMSGSFEDIDVPPTLISFAVAPGKASKVISQEIKPEKAGKIYLMFHERKQDDTPDYEQLNKLYSTVNELNSQGKIFSAMSVNSGGLVKALTNMCYGNKAGVNLSSSLTNNLLLEECYGSILIQTSESPEVDGFKAIYIGDVTDSFGIMLNDELVSLDKILAADCDVMEDIFPTLTNKEVKVQDTLKTTIIPSTPKAENKLDRKPLVLIPVFPGINGEWDMGYKFQNAGAEVEYFVFKNRNAEETQASFKELADKIISADILGLAGGISLGDEPDGSAKVIISILSNPVVKDAVTSFLDKKDSLILGLGNGFQALLKLGLLPYGRFAETTSTSPTVTTNKINRHISCYAYTKFISNNSPWLANINVGELYSVPVSFGEGRVVIEEHDFNNLLSKGQISSIYTDEGNSNLINQCGSDFNIEGMLSPDGRIFGKMGYSDRTGENIGINIPYNHDQEIFKAGVDFFK